MIDNRNMILAVVLSVAILLGFEYFFAKRQPPPEPAPAKPAELAQPAPQAPSALPTPTSVPAPASVQQAPLPPGAAPLATAQQQARQQALAATPRVALDSPRLKGSIALRGARFDDITLSDYRDDLKAGSPPVTLLHPKGSEHAYFAEFGWVGTSGGPAVPGPDAEWKADRAQLAPGSPVTLTWDNGQGLAFTRTIEIDDAYMFRIADRVENKGKDAALLHPYGLISRRGTPKILGFYILHEGPLAVFDGRLNEVNYSDVKEKRAIETKATSGWLGITDKYWLAALVPDPKAKVNARFVHVQDGSTDVYQADFLGAAVTVAPGAEATIATRLFAGAKEVKVLDAYAEALGIALFDRAIDFGWFYFITRPILYALIYIKSWAGNFGVAILVLTVVIKLLFFPLANKSYVAMSKMKKLQPEMMKLRERFGADKVRLNQELMALYKREKANPASGCVPIVIQIPVFFALYKVLFVNIEMRHAPFFGWIQDLSASDPTTIFNLFGLIPWAPPEFLMVGVWPLVMGGTMYLQQLLNPQPADPVQAKMFLMMPVIFTFLLAQFSAGLVIYWTWNNVLSITQQWVIMRRMGVKPGTS